MNFKTLFISLSLSGCALDLNGTSLLPADPPEADAASDSPTDLFVAHEASAPTIVDAGAPALPDASPGNPLGRPADPVAFKACLTTCTTGCCDPTGLCWPGTTDNACGIGAAACSDCTPYGGSCGDGGVCIAGPGASTGCPPPFKVNPNADGSFCVVI